MSIKDLPVSPVPEEVPFLNLLMYAETGVGKTRLGGSAAEVEGMYPMLVVDTEAGTTTLRQFSPEIRKRIEIVTMKERKDIEKLYNELVMDTSDYYKTVMLDSATEIQDLDMITIMKDVVRRDPDRDVDVPSQREWGVSRSHMRKIIRAYRDLPMHTIITCLVVEDKEDGRRPRYYPSLPGKLKSEIGGFMDIVGYMYKNDQQQRTIQFEGTQRVIAKDRTGTLGGFMVDPTLSKMMELIENGGSTANATAESNGQ
jgi:hypothetical protein